MKTIAAFSTLERTIIQRFLGALTHDPKPKSAPPNEHENNNEESCIANISPRERLKRLIGGVIPFVLTLGILTWQISTDVDRLWRLPLFIGINILPGSIMSGQIQWAIYGSIAFVAGIGLFVFANQRKDSSSKK